MTTSAFGQFLEFSVPAHDIQDSLNFYLKLGFTELPVGDIRDYHYGVITDGRIAIGLHTGGIDEPALTFVKPDVAESLQEVLQDEDSLSFSRLGIDTFHEVGVYSPDGHLLIMMEARTFSRAYLSELPTPFTGHSTEISLGCRDIEAATNYWSSAGFLANSLSADHKVELLAPGLCLSLQTDLPPGRMVLRFKPDDLEEALDSLDRCGIPVSRAGTNYRVTAPEGTHLDLVTADF